MLRARFRMAMAAMVTLLGSSPAWTATIRAVLVGVGTYSDPSLAPLDGARNDAVLMGETLARRFAVARSDMILLVDRAELARPTSRLRADGMPTRAAILAALAEAARATKAGDQLVILLSGHGAQQPEAIVGDEPDGLDEVFLPEDSAAPGQTGAHFGNAIVDGELGRALAAVLDRGGDVLLFADFCHSGDALRGSAPIRTSLGPDPRLDLVKAGEHAGRGRLTAFFTARWDREGAQRAAPFWDLPHAEPHGVLSFYAATALSDPGIRRYDELYDRINALVRASNDALIADNVPAELPSPEGRLDLPVLGLTAPAEARRGWSVEIPADPAPIPSLRLPAGSLAGVVSGALFAISTLDDGRPILYGRAETVEAWASVLRPAAGGGIDERAWRSLPRAAAPLFAREVERPLAPPIRVRLPRPPQTAGQRNAMRAIKGLDLAVTGVRLESAGEASLVLRFQGDALELATGDRATARLYGRISIGHVPPETIRSKLAGALARAARFHRIAGILDALSLAPGEGDPPIDTVRVDFFLQRPRKSPGRDQSCAPDDFAAGDPIPRDVVALPSPGQTGAAIPHFARCDALYISFVNRGTKPVYLAPVILAPEGAIYSLPTQSFGSMLFEPNREGTARYLLSTDPGGEPARDDLFLLAIEAGFDDRTPALSLAVEQPPILCDETIRRCADAPPPDARSGPKGTAGRQALHALLGETRATPLKIGQVGFRRYSWYTAPP